MKQQPNNLIGWKIYWCLLLGTLPAGAMARDLILITYHQAESLAVQTAQIMEEKTGIPASLIQLRQVATPCVPNRQTIWHLCLANDGRLKTLHQNQTVLQRSFAIFKPPRPRPLQQLPPRETQDLLQRLGKVKRTIR